MKNAPRKLKIAILVLIILLALSLLGLIGVQLYWYLSPPPTGTDKIPDNVIGPTTVQTDSTDPTDGTLGTEPTAVPDPTEAPTDATDPSTAPENTESDEIEADVTLSLYDRQPDYNEPFKVMNMLPGDSETKMFAVKVSYKDTVRLRFRTRVHEGYEKLAEVMMCRVVLKNTDQVLYEGLMRDVPATVIHKLYSAEPTDAYLYYEITAYLDTSVGNEYMRQSLIVDFMWDAMDEGNLIPPQTGDDFSVGLWAGMAVCSVVLLILLLVLGRRKKKEEQDGKD